MKKTQFEMKSEESLKSGRNIGSLVYGLMESVGISSNVNHVWKKRSSWLAYGCLVSCVSMMFVMIYKSRDDSEKVFECLSVLSFSGMSLLKLRCMRQNRLVWASLVETITTLENQQLKIENTTTTDGEYESDNEETELKISSDRIGKYTRRCSIVSRLIKTIYVFTLTVFITAPFIEYFFWKIVASETIDLPYVLPGWSFLNEMGISAYISAVLVQTIGACYCLIIHQSFDLIFVSFMIFVSGQYMLVRSNSERIGGKRNQLLKSKQRDERAHGRIKRCNRIHLRLMNFTAKISNLVKDILGIYFFVAAMTLCSIAYRLKTEQVGLMQTLSLLQYMSGNLVQLFMFCYYGGHMFDQSVVQMGEGPFAASYWCMGTKVRKELIILGAGMMRPSRISAGPFNYLDLSSFIQIVRAAYSYYAVLGK